MTVSRSQRPQGTVPSARRPPARGAAVGPGHAGVDPGLVEEHEPAWVDPGQLGPPRRPPLDDVGPVPLGGPERLFLRTNPRRFRARHSAATLLLTHVRS